MTDENSCGALLKQINDTLAKNANNAMRSQGITMMQCTTLLLLSDQPGQEMPMKEIERTLHVAQPTAAGIISRLAGKGFVAYRENPVDRRAKIVVLTDAGRDRCWFAERDMQKTEERLLSGLTETERRELLRLLRKVREGL